MVKEITFSLGFILSPPLIKWLVFGEKGKPLISNTAAAGFKMFYVMVNKLLPVHDIFYSPQKLRFL